MTKVEDIFKYNIPDKCFLTDTDFHDLCSKCDRYELCNIITDYQLKQIHGKEHWSIFDNRF